MQHMTKAQRVLQELGGNQFLSATGARLLTDVGNGLQFRLTGSRLVLVTMTGDLFDMTFYRLRGAALDNLGHFEMVPGYELAALFTAQTGAATR